MKKSFYLLPLALVLLVACNNNSEKETDHKDHDSTQISKEATESIHEHEEAESKVQLDNGKKWKANPETITGIANMQSLVQDGISGKTPLTALHEPLQLEFKTIFDKCTMTGESHNQLHNFLIPLKGDLEKVKAGNVNTESLKEIQEYLSTFKNYFE